MAIPDKADSLTSNYAMERMRLGINTGIQLAQTLFGIPLLGPTLSSVAATTASYLVNKQYLSNKFGLDMAANKAAQADLDLFLNSPEANKREWGNINTITSISTIEICDFEVGKDTIILLDLPPN